MVKCSFSVPSRFELETADRSSGGMADYEVERGSFVFVEGIVRPT